MAKYTMTIEEMMESGIKIDLETYPIFDESYRNVLNNKILSHFYFREIGLETPQKFNFFLRRRMNEIMPFYNQLYKSELIAFNPLITDYFTQKSSNGTERNETNDSVSLNKNSSDSSDNYSGIKRNDGNTTITEQSTGETSANEKTDTVNNKGYNSNSTINNDGTSTVNETVDNTVNTDENNSSKNSENIESTSKTTNDLSTHTITENQGTGSNRTTASKHKDYSDVPQAGYTTTRTEHPDGTVTVESTGYVTTVDDENSTQNDNTSTTENGDSTTENTGTVDVTGNSTKTVNITEDNSRNETGKKTTNKNEGTNNKETREENGTESQNGNTVTINSGTNSQNKTSEQGNKETLRDDNQRNTSSNSLSNTANTSKNKIVETGEYLNNLFGRRGVSPSDLIIKYRQTFLNIDMQIIEELENLFMGVY